MPQPTRPLRWKSVTQGACCSLATDAAKGRFSSESSAPTTSGSSRRRTRERRMWSLQYCKLMRVSMYVCTVYHRRRQVELKAGTTKAVIVCEGIMHHGRDRDRRSIMMHRERAVCQSRSISRRSGDEGGSVRYQIQPIQNPNPTYGT